MFPRQSIADLPDLAHKSVDFASMLSLNTLKAGECVVIPAEHAKSFPTIRTIVWRFNKRWKTLIGCHERRDGTMAVVRPLNDTAIVLEPVTPDDKRRQKIDFLRSMQIGSVQYVSAEDSREELNALIAEIGDLPGRFLSVASNERGLFVNCLQSFD